MSRYFRTTVSGTQQDKQFISGYIDEYFEFLHKEILLKTKNRNDAILFMEGSWWSLS